MSEYKLEVTTICENQIADDEMIKQFHDERTTDDLIRLFNFRKDWIPTLAQEDQLYFMNEQRIIEELIKERMK